MSAVGAAGNFEAEAGNLEARVDRLISMECRDKDCIRYVKRLRREKGHLSAFLQYDVDYHSSISERALGDFAEFRKILYGNRSEEGAERTKILMSVYATCEMRGVNFYRFAKDYLAGKITAMPAGRKAATVAVAA